MRSRRQGRKPPTCTSWRCWRATPATSTSRARRWPPPSPSWRRSAPKSPATTCARPSSPRPWTITPCPSTCSCSCIDGTGRPATTRPLWRRASAPMPEACSTCSRRREPRSARALPPRCSPASASCSRSSTRGRPPGSSSWPTSTRRKRRRPWSGSSRGSRANTRTSRPASAVPARDPRPCCNPGRSPWPRSRRSSSTRTRCCWCTGSARGATREATSGPSRPDR